MSHHKRKYEHDDAPCSSKRPNPYGETVVRASFTKPFLKEDIEKKAREELIQEGINEKHNEINRGISQALLRREKQQELEDAATENFARYKDDEKMKAHLLSQVVFDDPMRDRVEAKIYKKKMISGTLYPKYKGTFPQNRFDIVPGYRWDGVNRSNGFESKLASKFNEREADAELRYRIESEYQQ
uniref:BUD13 homolog n=1 Tax=Rhabditophanes sp. KR3021 TaxID=114890 RepID=A0AC35TSB4_9BILA